LWFNGDGVSDIVWWNASGSLVSIWLVSGSNVIGAGLPGSVSADWVIHTGSPFAKTSTAITDGQRHAAWGAPWCHAVGGSAVNEEPPGLRVLVGLREVSVRVVLRSIHSGVSTER